MDDWFGTMIDGLLATDLQSLDFREVLPRRTNQSDSFLVGISPPSPAGIPQKIYDIQVALKLFSAITVDDVFSEVNAGDFSTQIQSQIYAHRYAFANESVQYTVDTRQALSPKLLLDSIAVRKLGSICYYLPSSVTDLRNAIIKKGERFIVAQNRLRHRMVKRKLEIERAEEEEWRGGAREELKECY